MLLCQPCRMDTVWALLGKRFLAGKREALVGRNQCTRGGLILGSHCVQAVSSAQMDEGLSSGKAGHRRPCLYSFLPARRKPKSEKATTKNSSSVVGIREKKEKTKLFRLRLFLSKPLKPENARVS